MEVIQAKSAGFCFGVARAVKMARELAEADPRPRMLGSVIHNRHVTAALAAKGYVFAEAAIEMVPQNYIKLSSEEDIKNMTKMIDLLEENDDVQNVWHNWEQE